MTWWQLLLKTLNVTNQCCGIFHCVSSVKSGILHKKTARILKTLKESLAVYEFVSQSCPKQLWVWNWVCFSHSLFEVTTIIFYKKTQNLLGILIIMIKKVLKRRRYCVLPLQGSIEVAYFEFWYLVVGLVLTGHWAGFVTQIWQPKRQQIRRALRIDQLCTSHLKCIGKSNWQVLQKSCLASFVLEIWQPWSSWIRSTLQEVCTSHPKHTEESNWQLL